MEKQEGKIGKRCRNRATHKMLLDVDSYAVITLCKKHAELVGKQTLVVLDTDNETWMLDWKSPSVK